MSKVIYKVIDYRGRITLPWEFRKFLGIKGGDIIKLETDNDRIQINVSKMDLVEIGKQDPETVKAYMNAAVKAMTPEERIAFAAQLLEHMKGEEL